MPKNHINLEEMKKHDDEMEDALFETSYGIKKEEAKKLLGKKKDEMDLMAAKKDSEEMDDDKFEAEYGIKKDSMKNIMKAKWPEFVMAMEKDGKPMLNFEDLFQDCQALDALGFKTKYGIEKEMGKNILDKMWIEKLCKMSKEDSNVAELYNRKNFLKSITEVEIFEPGYHNGQTFTAEDIEEIYKATKQAMEQYNLQPPVKLGHSMEQAIAKALFGNDIEAGVNDSKGMPALGWMQNLQIKAGKIVTDLVNIPDKLYDMLKDKMYATRSIELWDGYTAGDGKNLGPVITGLALLGAEIPAVTTLANAFNANPKVKAFNTFAQAKESETNMEVKKEKPAVELNSSVASFDMSQFKSQEEVNAKLLEFKQQADEGAKAIKLLAEFKKAEKEEKTKNFLNEMAKEGKLLPFQREILKPVLTELVEAKEVEYFDAKTEVNKKAKLFDLMTQFIQSLPNQVKMQEMSKTGSKEVGETLDSVAKTYSLEHKVSYEAAIKQILRTRPELADTDSKVQKGDN